MSYPMSLVLDEPTLPPPTLPLGFDLSLVEPWLLFLMLGRLTEGIEG